MPQIQRPVKSAWNWWTNGYTVLFGLMLVVCASVAADAQESTRKPTAAGKPEQKAALSITRLLPERALFLWLDEGLETHQAGWEKTAAHDSLSKSGVLQLGLRCVEVYTQMAIADASTTDEAKKLIGEVWKTVQLASQKGFAIAVCIPEGPGFQGPSLTVVLPHGGALDGPLKQMISAYQSQPKPQPVAPAVNEADTTSTDEPAAPKSDPPAAAPKEIASDVPANSAVPASEPEWTIETIENRKISIATSVVQTSEAGMQEVEFAFWNEQGHFVFVLGYDAVKRTLAVADGKAPDITSNRIWKELHNGTLTFERRSLGWIDGEMLRTVCEGISFSDPNFSFSLETLESILEFAFEGLGEALENLPEIMLSPFAVQVHHVAEPPVVAVPPPDIDLIAVPPLNDEKLEAVVKQPPGAVAPVAAVPTGKVVPAPVPAKAPGNGPAADNPKVEAITVRPQAVEVAAEAKGAPKAGAPVKAGTPGLAKKELAPQQIAVAEAPAAIQKPVKVAVPADVADVDVPPLKKAADPAVPALLAKPEVPEALQTGKQILTALGLDNIQHYAWQSGYKGRALWTESYLAAPSPRRGLLAVADSPALQLDQLPPLPVDNTGFYATSFDMRQIGEVYGQIVKSYTSQVAPETAAELERSFKTWRDENGALYDNLVQSVDPIICVYNDGLNGPLSIGPVLAWKIKDATRVRRGLNKIVTMIGTPAANVPPPMIRRVAANEADPEEEVVEIPVDQERVEITSSSDLKVTRKQRMGREIVGLQTSEFPLGIAYVVDEEWLVVSLNSQVLEAFLLRRDGKLPRWEPSEAHRDALKEMPAKFTSITVENPRASLTNVVSLGYCGLALLEAAVQSEETPAEMKKLLDDLSSLPPAELIVQPLFPNVTVTTTEASGLRTYSRTSVPSLSWSNYLIGFYYAAAMDMMPF